MAVADSADGQAEVARARRPQYLALMLFGLVVYERPVVLAASSVIDILGELGISDYAVRSTLTRMTDRGLLARYRRGREVYWGLTEHGSAVLRGGQTAAHQSPDGEWDGTWTVLGFSLPEDQRALRHQLRSRLTWGGFGVLHSGMWIAPGVVNVASLLEDLKVEDRVQVFTATPAAPTEIDQLILDAYDLDEIAHRYTGFLARWGDHSALSGHNPLGTLLILQSEWAQLARADPRLPLAHLPDDWPAVAAFELYHRLHRKMSPHAEQLCATRARTVEITDEERDRPA
ncbi:MAG TPA: PaaX family transcriptional regulator C-terminal domain-containing protein [Streptosporangiaceae bacterium]|nr:PaaX family transcriptional regulator C-terminal domain-containing protein [Streptosporangiaceae bacterium]